jgi:lipopolysaccharide export system permease protein
MGILDRYVLALFTRVFVICFVSLTGMFVVGDFVGNLNEFLDHSPQQGGLAALMAAYYGARVPWFFDTTSRALALVAAVFTITWLQRHNEMTALMAAGIPQWRIVKPLLGAVVLISLLAAVNRETAIPALRERLSRDAQDWRSGDLTALQPRHDHETDILLGGQAVLAGERRIEKPSFLLPPELQDYGRQLRAAHAEYQDADGQRPRGFLLREVTEPPALDQLPSIVVRGRPVVLFRRDTPWLGPGECFVATNITFEQLIGGTTWRQFASTVELLRGLHNPSLDYGADVRVTVHARVVQPLLDILLLLLGLPVVVARQSRNVFVTVGFCMVLLGAFFGVVLACHSLGMNYLISPSLAAWLPLLIFVPCAAVLTTPRRA